MSNQTAPRRPGRPRVQQPDPRRRTTITLPESLLAEIDANLGERDSERSRNRWLEAAARAYLTRAEDVASASDWRELRALVLHECTQATQPLASLVETVNDLSRTTARPPAMTPEQRAYVREVRRMERLRGEMLTASTKRAAFGVILARMDTLQQWSDATVHPVAHQD